MLQYDFDQSIGYWVIMTANAMERELNEELSSLGITLRQWQVLAWLTLQGELSQRELADLMHIEQPTLTGILERMERNGWIERRPCPLDRRKKLIRPTEAVEPVWHRMVECAQRVRERAARGIPPEEIETMKKTLAQIQNNLEAAKSMEQEAG